MTQVMDLKERLQQMGDERRADHQRPQTCVQMQPGPRTSHRRNGKLQTRWRDGAEALVLSRAVDEVALVLPRAADEVALATELPHAPLFPKARGAALAPAASPFPALAPTALAPADLIGTYCRAHRHEQMGPGNSLNVAPTMEYQGVNSRHAIIYSKFDCGLW
jgi:hypothetical protein